MTFQLGATLGRCRYAEVPACEPSIAPPGTSTFTALDVYQIKRRDILDFGVDFAPWMAGNGNPSLSGATWAVASGSPKTPIIESQSHTADGKTVAIIKPANDAVKGDTYYVEITATFAAVPASEGQPSIAARTLVRRIHIIVVEG